MADSVVHALAGAGGGIVSMSLTYPLITISTRSQVDTSAASSKKSQWEIGKGIVKEEGVAGLYSGVKSALVGIAITQAIYYYWYELIKSILARRKRLAAGHAGTATTAAATAAGAGVLESMLTGGIAGSITAILTNPIWVVNTRLLVKSDERKDQGTKGTPKKDKKIGMWAAARKVYQDDGILGFWRGVLPALALVSNPIIQYTVFERLKKVLEKTRGELSSYHYFLLGAVSKLCATGLTYPYIVIKSRMHVSKSKKPSVSLSDTPPSPSSSIIASFKQVVKDEGVAGLYKGISSKLIQSVLTSALMFGFKEQFFRLAMFVLVSLKLRKK